VVVSDLDELKQPQTRTQYDHWHKTNLSLFRNDWLIRHPRNHHYIAHPEFLSRNGKVIGRFVVTADPWETIEAIPDRLFREIQWELLVTGASYCAVTWLEGEISDGSLYSKEPVPKVGIVIPNLAVIAKLIEAAEDLWHEVLGPRIRAGSRINFASFLVKAHYVKPPADLAQQLSWTIDDNKQGSMGPWKWKPWGMEMWDLDPISGELLRLMVHINVDENSYTAVEIGTFESEAHVPEGMMKLEPVSRDMSTVKAHTATSRNDFFGTL